MKSERKRKTKDVNEIMARKTEEIMGNDNSEVRNQF